MLKVVLIGLQVLASLALITAIALQTTKSEQGGGGTFGWGIIGGKSTTALHTRWGVEAHMERITSGVAIAFLVLSALAAVVQMRGL